LLSSSPARHSFISLIFFSSTSESIRTSSPISSRSFSLYILSSASHCSSISTRSAFTFSLIVFYTALSLSSTQTCICLRLLQSLSHPKKLTRVINFISSSISTTI
jgi:hypothetical protein